MMEKMGRLNPHIVVLNSLKIMISVWPPLKPFLETKLSLMLKKDLEFINSHNNIVALEMITIIQINIKIN